MTHTHTHPKRTDEQTPARPGFLPATGTLTRLRTPAPVEGRVRVETGVVEGDEVSMYYDPMIAKLLTWCAAAAAALHVLPACLPTWMNRIAQVFL